MRLSPDTLTILKNFSHINPSLCISKGNVLRVLSPAQNMFAKATIAETFPNTVRIYDMNQWLGVVALLSSADMDVQEKSMIFKDGGKQIEYVYADAFLLPETPDIRLAPEKIVLTATLQTKVLETAQRMALLLDAKQCAFVGKGGEAKLTVGKTASRDKTHNYTHVIGPCTEEFVYRFSLDELKIVPDEYAITLGSRGKGEDAQGIMHLKGTMVEYFVAADKDSTL
jgi:hypothetical protein